MPRTVRTARAPTDLKPNLIRIKKRNDERADRRKGGERVKEFQQLGTSDQVFGRPRTGYVAHTILTDAALMMRATGRVARAELDEMRPILVTRASTARIRRRPPQTRNGAALATPSYSLVPPGGFEPSTPALGGHELLPYLRFFIFINISVSAGNLAILPFLLFLISFLFHPIYTPLPLHFDLQG